jgi:hypothetical protein
MTAGQVGAFAGPMAGVVTGPMALMGLVFGLALAAGVLRTAWNRWAKFLGACWRCSARESRPAS